MIEPAPTIPDRFAIDCPAATCHERLSMARRKIHRLTSGASALALWSVDFGEVSAAATSVDDAIRSLEAECAFDASAAWTPSSIAALATLEARLLNYERSMLANVGTTVQ